MVNWIAALRFFFVKTLKRHQFRDFLSYPQDQRRLPTVLSREEVSRLINAAGTLFRRTLLMNLYGTWRPTPNYLFKLQPSLAQRQGMAISICNWQLRLTRTTKVSTCTTDAFRSRTRTTRLRQLSGSQRLGRQRRNSFGVRQDNIRCLFANHVHCTHNEEARNAWKHRSIDHPQPFRPVN